MIVEQWDVNRGCVYYDQENKKSPFHSSEYVTLSDLSKAVYEKYTEEFDEKTLVENRVYLRAAIFRFNRRRISLALFLRLFCTFFCW